MNYKKTIGILGGMGPLASANLYYKIIKIAQKKYGAEQDGDFPPMIIYNLPLIGFDETGFVKPELVKKQLANAVKKLEQAGSNFVVMACNTVHYFINELQKKIKIPILNIVKETAKQAKIGGFKTVGLLTSETAWKLKLYQKELKKHNIKSIAVETFQQKIINKIILRVMAERQNKNDTKILKKIIGSLCQKGAKGIIVGCTELPLAIKQKDVEVKLFDTTKIMAELALKYACNKS